VRRLADREDDVLGQLRQEQHVGHVGVERLLEERRVRSRGEHDHRRGRLLADRGQLVDGQRGRPGRVEHGAEVAAGESRRCLADLLARADDLELRVVGERLAEILEAFARPREVDADALAGGVIGLGHLSLRSSLR
jgi:hypothetical protein